MQTHEHEWLEAIGGFLVMVIFVLGPPLLFAFIAWRLFLRSQPLNAAGCGLLFIASALSAVTIYGHAGPVPAVIFLFVEPEPGLRLFAIIWMISTGLLVTGLFVWRSRRLSGQRSR